MLFSIETLKAYTQSKGIPDIEDEDLKILAQDLEYRLKELAQEASKFMMAAKRSKLSIEDVNYALLSKEIDPLLGYNTSNSLVFKTIPGSNLYYVPDEELDLESILNSPLPKIPHKPVISKHWLAIEGVQPQIPQNPLPMERMPEIKKEDTLAAMKEDIEIRNHMKHLLSKELQLYYEKIVQFIKDKETVALASECLKNESGIQQLIPYFVHFFNEEILKNLRNGDYLVDIISVYESLIMNKMIFIEPYMHQMLPSLLTCVVGKSIGIMHKHPSEEVLVNDSDEDTPGLSARRRASITIKYIYDTYSLSYTTLAPRVLNTLLKTWADSTKSPESHYGAIYCLCNLGEKVINGVVIQFKKEYLDKTDHIKYSLPINLLNKYTK
ncbi:transcription initiation factor TFIID subunit 6 [Nematocida parisii]|uniref:Transcription initiation factor TFIID 70kda subunit n=1 Tax=Nematocida parisii (strain ERTm3) TaxID=935791 RepID=I3EIH9_NEMP3|nr:transcription initiation factor TFIID 70kda subunit [Nematocida parisii ERTm1]EIJ89026.1 transcription initiation factor TFIID 70kda subunit [Nematocida parisii ERTm3]KAI5125979.1 transcription initiation factor TFIID subunit 6 [Nematocida parisii]EIJ93419.1 transcription initiation factor TFIID 70kda subunit [Nematocida parisii ERTm1]KAI5126244.1 transcription initiation factor TFIID subunit 6 [Nematocida parisii]KAI5140489.1 transcription initiation factor TFIID subunit 6 [Nematocida pari|eukprot:XP_013059589.1 transcription initiation factor TFIID 70kda subunit [Nematocida parisii ERTm1]